jgi:hypothetical protein
LRFALSRLHSEWFTEGKGSTRLFRCCAALSLLLQAVLIFRREGLWGGSDLVPHLRIIELIRDQPGLYNPYAPAYHVIGALAAPIVGLELYPKLFALGAAAALIAGFRFFQRAAGLPDAAASIFVFTPYVLSLSFCTPKVEAAGYGLLLFGLGLLVKRRYIGAGAALAATFYVHTASALLFGIAGGVVGLARRDGRALAALAGGTLGAAPLVLAHLADGCSLSEAFLFASGGYTRRLAETVIPGNWRWLVPLLNPLALCAALAGARETWRLSRPLGILCGVLVALYLNNVWLAPFDVRTLLTLTRGLSLLAIPVAISAGVWAAARPRALPWLIGLSAAWALLSLNWVVPEACFTRPIPLNAVHTVRVDRCAFVWRRERALRVPRGSAPARLRGGAGGPADTGGER